MAVVDQDTSGTYGSKGNGVSSNITGSAVTRAGGGGGGGVNGNGNAVGRWWYQVVEEMVEITETLGDQQEPQQHR